MDIKPPDRKILDEVVQLKKRIGCDSFEALSTGIGIGNLKPILKEASSQQADIATAKMVNSNLALLDYAKKKELKRNKHGTPLAPRPAATGSRSKRWLAAHLIDISIVCIGLFCGLVIVGYFVDPKNLGLSSYARVCWLPKKIFNELGLLKSLFGIYFIFTGYWLFFKIFNGTTIGTSICQLER